MTPVQRMSSSCSTPILTPKIPCFTLFVYASSSSSNHLKNIIIISIYNNSISFLSTFILYPHYLSWSISSKYFGIVFFVLYWYSVISFLYQKCFNNILPCYLITFYLSESFLHFLNYYFMNHS